MKNLRVLSYAVLGAAILARRVVRHMKAHDLRDKAERVTGGVGAAGRDRESTPAPSIPTRASDLAAVHDHEI